MTIHGAIPPEYQNVTDTNVGKMTEQDAINRLQFLKRTSPYIKGFWSEIDMAIEALQFQQGIVRCKDCKYITSRSTCDYWSSIEWFGRFTDDEEFCSRGKRRDEE